MSKHIVTRHFALFSAPVMPPDPKAVYHAYFIMASDWMTPGSGIATVWALTDDTPAPNPPHIVVKKGGAQAAVEEADRIVCGLGGNVGLTRLP